MKIRPLRYIIYYIIINKIVTARFRHVLQISLETKYLLHEHISTIFCDWNAFTMKI